MSWIEPFINEYIAFIKQNTFVQENTGTEWVSISTPMVDMHNDAIEIFAKKKGDQIVLSDDGTTLSNLKDCGLDFSKAGRKKEMLEQILTGYGIHLEKGELTTVANTKNFAQRKLNLLQAIGEANDLHVLSKPQITHLFFEDVESFFSSNRVIYTPHFIARGSSGLEFNFDFQLASFEKETLIKTFHTLAKQSVVSFLYGWADVKEAREKQTKRKVESIAIINDLEKKPKADLIEALENKGAHVLLWSERDSSENKAYFN
ncbi:MAG: DUF1828 domain-containing protein [Chitinophagaceae bacterium]|nr:DUF1828 domain-containing protein [Chitinophagaceae bacterium]